MDIEQRESRETPVNVYKRARGWPELSARSFTLLELIIAMMISTMIGVALYFSFKTALDSWDVSQEQFVLQQVSSRIMEELVEGLPDTNGLRDALEVIDGSSSQAVTVMPWVDDTHEVYNGINIYTLNKHIKPGTSLPMAEVLLPGLKEYKVVPISLIEEGKSDDYPQASLDMSLPAGSRLRFVFFPDYSRDIDAVTTFRYDSGEQSVFVDDKDGSREIYKNPFGVKITDFRMRYFDNTNTEVGENGSVSSEEIQAVTGIEIAFKARSKNGNERETITFVSLRNAPMHSGNITLKEGVAFLIPDSKEVKALSLCNLSGIDSGDYIVLKARTQTGKSWRLKIQFSKFANASQPLIENYTIEYPAGNQVFSDRPRTPVEFGLNLLKLGPNGLYDYGFNDIDGEILLDGKVTLEVEKMDISGAAVFVKP